MPKLVNPSNVENLMLSHPHKCIKKFKWQVINIKTRSRKLEILNIL